MGPMKHGRHGAWLSARPEGAASAKREGGLVMRKFSLKRIRIQGRERGRACANSYLYPIPIDLDGLCQLEFLYLAEM